MVYVGRNDRMIAFSCTCGHKYNVSEKYAGKKVRCKECSEIFIIPILNRDKHQAKPLEYSNPIINEYANEAFEGGHCSQRSGPTSTTPTWIWYFFGVVGIFVVSLMLWVFVFRDTWEIDNLMKISRMISEAKSLVAEKDLILADRKYDELSALIGNRELKNENLKQDILIALNEHETVKNIIRKEKERQAEMARLEEQRRKIAEEKKRQAEEERQRRIAEEERMANPPVAYSANCKSFFSKIKEGDFCQFILLKRNHAVTHRIVSGGRTLRTGYFEKCSVWANGKYGSKYNDFKVDSDFYNYIQSTPNGKNDFKAVLSLYHNEGRTGISMRLSLPISKKGLIDITFPEQGETVLVKCKIDKVTVVSQEMWDEYKTWQTYLPIGSRHLEATAYFIKKIDFENPLAKSLLAEISVMRKNEKAQEEVYSRQQEEKREHWRKVDTQKSSTKSYCNLCGGSGVAMTCSDIGMRDNLSPNGIPEYGPCPNCSR